MLIEKKTTVKRLVARLFTYMIMAFAAFIILAPLYLVLVTAFKSSKE